MYTKVCVTCGKTFKTDRHNRKSCSDMCAYIRKEMCRKPLKPKKKKAPKLKAKEKMACVVCGKVFEKTHPRQKTCSKECSHRNGILKGEEIRKRKAKIVQEVQTKPDNKPYVLPEHLRLPPDLTFESRVITPDDPDFEEVAKTITPPAKIKKHSYLARMRV